MLRKIISLVLVISMFMVTLVFGQASSEMNVLAKISAVEIAVYGNEQTGSLVERLDKLEIDLYGNKTNDAFMSKTDNLYAEINTNSAKPSLMTKINAVEWAINKNVTSLPIKQRIENNEKFIEGNVKTGALMDRLNSLTEMAFPGGVVNTSATPVGQDTLVKIKIMTPLNSKITRIGDIVNYQVAEDVFIDGKLVFVTGAEGQGKVSKVKQAQNFGRDAELEIDFEHLTAVDGQKLATFLGDKAKEETKSMAIAAGATVAGLVVLGPVGIVTGAFIKGEDVKVPEGALMYIQTKTENTVYAIVTN